MYSMPIKYTDFDGNNREETFMFHLSPAELVDLESSYPGGMKRKLERALAKKDNVTIMAVFKKLVELSYGEKSDDGKRFMKSPDIWKEFSESNAYVELFMKLVTDSSAAQAFVDAVLPDMTKYSDAAVMNAAK